MSDYNTQMMNSREYAESMCEFRESQIKRLTAYIKGIES